ncbi:hypothetical protein [Burkholderia sp. 3C]
MTTYLYDATVAFISSKAEHHALSIQSAEMTAFQTSLFEVPWEASTPDGDANPGD